jgi:hypothetical protein
MEAIERVLQIKRLLTYNLLAWCLLGILSAVQRYSYAISFGQEFSWQSLIRHPLSTYLAYWTLSYLVIDLFLLSRRWHTRRFVILHIPASMAFSLLHKLMAYISGLLLERLFLPHETLNWQELIVLWQASWFDLIIGVAVYWVILFVLMALDYWQQFREQYTQSATLRNQLTEAQLQSMRMQLQPHFLFNALNTITMMVRRKDQQQAISMIIGLSEMLRNSLSQNKKPFIKLEEELKLIGHYLQVEQGRFQDRLQLTMDIEETTLDMMVPNLILQPIVENAFKHGIAHSMDQAELRLSSRFEDDFLVLEVFNSSDMAPHEWVLSRSKGIGLRNTIGRLRQLYKGRARLQFTEQENGVLVSLRLPASTEKDTFAVRGELEKQ